MLLLNVDFHAVQPVRCIEAKLPRQGAPRIVHFSRLEKGDWLVLVRYLPRSGRQGGIWRQTRGAVQYFQLHRLDRGGRPMATSDFRIFSMARNFSVLAFPPDATDCAYLVLVGNRLYCTNAYLEKKRDVPLPFRPRDLLWMDRRLWERAAKSPCLEVWQRPRLPVLVGEHRRHFVHCFDPKDGRILASLGHETVFRRAFATDDEWKRAKRLWMPVLSGTRKFGAALLFLPSGKVVDLDGNTWELPRTTHARFRFEDFARPEARRIRDFRFYRVPKKKVSYLWAYIMTQERVRNIRTIHPEYYRRLKAAGNEDDEWAPLENFRTLLEYRAGEEAWQSIPIREEEVYLFRLGGLDPNRRTFYGLATPRDRSRGGGFRAFLCSYRLE